MNENLLELPFTLVNFSKSYARKQVYLFSEHRVERSPSC